MPEEMIIAMATAVILSAVKNPAKKASLRKSMAKIYKTIGNMYAGDAEFQALVGSAAVGTGGD